MSDKPTIEETAQFIFGLIVKSVVSAATQIEESIIKKNQSKINRVFSLLKRRKGNNGLAQVKLYLDLLIPHIVVAAVEIETNPKFNPHYAEILEFMTNEYLLIFQGAAKGINEGVVDANYFVKDAGERQVVFLSSKSYTDTNEMVNQLVDKKFNEPTPMLLISLADFLFKIRSHQYKKLWLSDLKEKNSLAL